MNLNWILISIEFILLMFSAAFFSGTETAITAITNTQFKTIKKIRTKKNKKLINLIEKKEQIVSTALIGTNFVNTLLSALVTAFVLNEYGQKYLPVATAITTILIIVFAEIIPKAFATYRAVEITKNSASILNIIHTILKPVVFVFSVLSKFVINIFSKKRPVLPEEVSEDYLKTLVKISLEDGTFQTGEHDLIRRAVQLHELKLHNIMTQRDRIAGFEESSSLEVIIQTFKKTMFSRLAVFNSKKAGIIGLVHYKDIIFYMANNKKFDLSKIIRPAIFISKTANIFSAIKIMSNNKQNMAFVIDEYGVTLGLITIDDITSAVFGASQDEYLKSKSNPLQGLGIINGTRMRIPAIAPIVKVNELLHTDFHSEYYDTMGGLILEKTELLPKEGNSIKIGKVNFTIEKIETGKIISLIADISELVFM